MEKQTSKEFNLLCSPILATPALLSSEQSENEYVNFDNSTSRKLIAISALFFLSSVLFFYQCKFVSKCVSIILKSPKNIKFLFD